MPQLDLRADHVQSATSLDLSYLSAVMLYPDDGEKRERIIEAIEAYALTQALRANAETLDAERPPFSEVADLVDLIASSPRLRDLQNEDMERRLRNSWIAGSILRLTVAWRALNPTMAQLGTAKRKVAKGRGVSVKLIDTDIWPAWRPVAHLCAAWVTLCLERGVRATPCAADDLPMFLASAENFRTIGESFKPKGASHPVLDSAQTWRLPDAIVAALPTIHIKWERKKPF